MKNGRDAARALLLQQERRVGDAGQAADAGADQNAGALLLLGRVGLEAGIGDRLIGRRHGVDDEVVDLALLLRLHPIVGIELAVGRGAARNEAGDLAGEVGSLELGRCGARRSAPASSAFHVASTPHADGRHQIQVR